MRFLLQFGLMGIGVSAVLIGFSFFFLGSSVTANFFSSLLANISSVPSTITGFDNANIDGEFRFYSVFWFAYGLCLIQVCRNLDQKLTLVPILLSLFFAGGVGRVLSILEYGPPHLLFQILLCLELGLPIVLMMVWMFVRRGHQSSN